MERNDGLYSLRQGLTVNELKQEAEALLLSILMMIDLLQKQPKQPLTLTQRYLIKTMNDLLLHVLTLFMQLYAINSAEALHYLQQESTFLMKPAISQEQLQNDLLDKIYQLGALNTIAVNDLLDQFTETNGNILITSAQRLNLLTLVLESLILFSDNNIHQQNVLEEYCETLPS